ncbi:MAG: bifunctional riboflavin kinase/FAD synthetase [Myxococcales bacterium]|nr:bifunctional riboflavin kinase/FAD synthetase [Myxococcales bacterium]
MKQYRLEELAPGALGPTLLTIGNFDGVHRGHQYILAQLRAAADKQHLPAVALTFEPHPIKVLYPQKNLEMIMPFAERARLFDRYGIDVLLTVRFTPELAQTPADEWVRAVLVELLTVKMLYIGYDFSFGRGRDGDALHLKRLGQKYGFLVHQLPPEEEDGKPISSSRIRRLVAAGEVQKVEKLLGRPFHLRGEIVPGDGRGRGLGFPTANLRTEWELLPHIGVYAAVAVVDGVPHPAAVNIGKNPTFNLEELRIEAYLLDFSGDLHGKEMALYFVNRLRDEIKFDSAAQLVEEMEKDIIKTRRLFDEKPPQTWLR